MWRSHEKSRPLDVSEFLDSDAHIASYLASVLEDNDTQLLLQAFGHIAKAKGMSEIAKASGISRDLLYESFGQDAEPRFEVVMKVLHALNIRFEFIHLTSVEKQPTSKRKSNNERKRLLKGRKV
ncbi:MAG: putative addiction module antidote protein [Fibrobacteres bacterium]|jgi:probable addiction module antidote protein|nr:putative addiction module antidote protein [Fibrobacterota bacterium]